MTYGIIGDILNATHYEKGDFKMALIGYARVSTHEQNEARQISAFEEMGTDRIFLDKCSGKDADRPELKKMLEYVREGDRVIVTEYSRLARSTSDLLRIVEELTKKGVQLVSLKESLDTSTPQGKLMLTMFAGLAEFERAVILERQREGIAIAKARGKYKGRKPIPVDEARFRAECAKWRRGEQSAVCTMKKFDMKPNRFYRRVREMGL